MPGGAGGGEEEGEGEDEEVAPEQGGEDVVAEEVEPEGGEAGRGGERRAGLLGVAVETLLLEGLAAGRSDVGHGGAATGQRGKRRREIRTAATRGGQVWMGMQSQGRFIMQSSDAFVSNGNIPHFTSTRYGNHNAHNAATLKAQKCNTQKHSRHQMHNIHITHLNPSLAFALCRLDPLSNLRLETRLDRRHGSS